jgi:hypothetical protein
MSVITGLAGLRAKQQEQAEKEAARNRPKAEYFNWKDNSKATNPDQILVQFIQELDPSATGYVEENGLAVAAVEHEAPGPKGYLARALCTLDSEGQCYACERRKADYQEGWKTKTNLYINALVDYNGKGEPVTRVISRNFNQSFAQQLMDEAVENGTITDKVYKVTRHGSGTQTVWVLSPTSKPLFKVAEPEVFDLKETVLRDISYDRQPDYFGRVWDGPEGETADAPAAGGRPAATASEDVEW